MAQSVGVERLYLSHFRVHMDAPESHQKAIADLKDLFEKDAGIVEDLDVFEI